MMCYRVFVLFLILGSIATSSLSHAADMTITGMLLTPTGIIEDGQISVSGQWIVSAGPRDATSKKAAVSVHGILIPGFIDLHNHLTWNVLPRWLPSRKFATRYQWQDTAEYDRLLVMPHAEVLRSAACESEIYAEIKALAGGATSVVGSLLPSSDHPDYADCARGLARNLDLPSALPIVMPAIDDCNKTSDDHDTVLTAVVDNEVFPLELTHRRMDFLLCELDANNLRSLIFHLAEGAPTDSSAHREFTMISRAGLLIPGLVLVHGTALRDQDFTLMENRVGLVWSPRSNDELYGSSTDVSLAMKDGVAVAIAPDWSPSGSAGMLQEMGYVARRYQTIESSRLVAMATSVPATIARVDRYLGALQADKLADFIVLNVNIDPKGAKPLEPIVRATPADVALVVVGGEAVYGDKGLLEKFLPVDAVSDLLTVCGKEKAIYLGQSAAAVRHESLTAIQDALKASLARAGSHLPDIECD